MASRAPLVQVIVESRVMRGMSETEYRRYQRARCAADRVLATRLGQHVLPRNQVELLELARVYRRREARRA